MEPNNYQSLVNIIEDFSHLTRFDDKDDSMSEIISQIIKEMEDQNHDH